MPTRYPPVGFHFKVAFENIGVLSEDAAFSEVSGLIATINTESVNEGGQNRFAHKLPTRTSYNDVTLKRGLLVGSAIYEWCRAAIDHFTFAPVNVLITLLNQNHEPLSAWYLVNAFPVKWDVSSFNAEQSQIVVESLTLSYNYFTVIKV